MAHRNDQGTIVENNIDGTEEPVAKLYVVDAGDNVIESAGPEQFSRLRRKYKNGLREGKLHVVGLTGSELQ